VAFHESQLQPTPCGETLVLPFGVAVTVISTSCWTWVIVNPLAFAGCVLVLALINSGGLWTLRPGRRR
jgi:hypothetical protein